MKGNKAMEMKNIRTDRATAIVTYMGEEMTFKYRPGAITPKTYMKLNEVKDPEELGEFFETLIVSWDLTQNGDPLEVTRDNIAELPMGLIRAMSQEVLQAVPQREEGKE